MKLSDILPDEKPGFGNESKLEEDRKPPDQKFYPGQSIIIEQKIPVRPPTVAVKYIFSPTDGCTNAEWDLLDERTRANAWTAQDIEAIDRYWRGEFSWKWDVFPALKAHALMVDKQREQARLKVDQIKREEAIYKIGRVHLPCDCGENGRWIDPSRVSYNRVLKAADSKFYVDCSVCGAQFWVDFKIGARKQ